MLTLKWPKQRKIVEILLSEVESTEEMVSVIIREISFSNLGPVVRRPISA